MKVLLAEDGAVNQLVATRHLEERGHSVVVAANGRQALGALEREEFDAVLMDVQMPELDGYEATRAIRESEEGTGRHLPIIAMTANAMKGDRTKCLEAGMDDYVAKPIRSRALFATLERYAPQASPGEQGAPAEKETAETSPSPPQARDEDGGEIFDAEDFARECGSVELRCQLIEFFEEDAPAMLAQVESACEGGEAEEIHRATHALKGMIGNYCGAPAFRQAAQIDEDAASGELERVRAGLPELSEAIDRLGQALRDYRARIAE